MNREEARAQVAVTATAMLAEIDAAESNKPLPAASEGHPWPNVEEGGRHASIVTAAGYCRNRGYTLHHALLAIHDWNRANRPPEEEAEVSPQIRDVYGRYDQGAVEPASPPFVKLSDLWTQEIVEREWLIPGFLPAGQRMAFVGRWEAGKSLVALDAAHGIAYGAKFLGLTDVSARGNVVILDGEGGKDRAVRRSNALRIGQGLPPDGCEGDSDIYWRWTAGLSLSSASALDTMRAEMTEIAPKLIIFDTLAKVMGTADENSNAMATRVTQTLYTLNHDLGATVVVIAHPAKVDGTSTSVRGAGELSADMDVIWSVQREEDDTRTIRCKKDRDGDLNKTSLRFGVEEDENGSIRLVGSAGPAGSGGQDHYQKLVLDLLHEAGPLRAPGVVEAMGQRAGVGKSTVYQTLKALFQSGEIVESDGNLSVAPRPTADEGLSA